MKYRLPPLNGLIAFEAAARTGNFARAADELNLTQSTISHRVRMLERYLGYPLFERLPRGLRLTESGKAYLPSIRKAFEQIFSSTAGIFGRKDQGSLTVRAPVSYSVMWLGPLIDGFMREYPGIEIRLISSIWADEIAADETDIDLRLGFGNWPRCRAREVLRDRVTAVCHPRLGRGIKGVEDIAARPLIHVMGIEDLWMKYFDQAGLGLDVKHTDIHVDSTIAALEIAASGSCVGLIQQRFLGHYLQSRRLAAPLAIEMDMEQAIYLVEPESRPQLKPEAILFGEWLDRLGE
ncbi:MAG: LysR substrate-binding domain-containing protein [Gammaproteobacteria bacterium]|jgi:LysR family glycine cleavage system transcriptional activator